MWSVIQPKFWPKKLVTSVQTRKNVAITVSRVACRFRRVALALKNVEVSVLRSSSWRWSSPVTWTRWSPTSRRYSLLLRVRPGRSRIARARDAGTGRAAPARAGELLDLLLEPVDLAELRLARVVEDLASMPSIAGLELLDDGVERVRQPVEHAVDDVLLDSSSPGSSSWRASSTRHSARRTVTSQPPEMCRWTSTGSTVRAVVDDPARTSRRTAPRPGSGRASGAGRTPRESSSASGWRWSSARSASSASGAGPARSSQKYSSRSRRAAIALRVHRREDLHRRASLPGPPGGRRPAAVAQAQASASPVGCNARTTRWRPRASRDMTVPTGTSSACAASL